MASLVHTTNWPEPVQRVQLLAESGLTHIPSQYIRPLADRPSHLGAVGRATPASPLLHRPRDHYPDSSPRTGAEEHGADGCLQPDIHHCRSSDTGLISIPVLDLADLESEEKRRTFLKELRRACEEWGFFHLKNHGVAEELVEGVRGAAGQFFKLPMSEKQEYANDPVTYQGYGSRLGVSKGAVLDWGDYFFLNVLPHSVRDITKWPTNPPQWRGMVEEYSKEVKILCKKLLKAMSMSLGLEEEGEEGSRLEEAFGEIDMGLRINYYPPCPQPELTLGLSPHSDPGGLTLLLQDHHVAGLQVKAPSARQGHHLSATSSTWVTVPPLPGTLLVNVGDQLQILTNGKYKSVEHRVVVNNMCQRLSLACFLNPSNDTLVAPLAKLVPKHQLPAYTAMTFKQYRSFIRTRGTNGKAHLESIASPTYNLHTSSPITS